MNSSRDSESLLQVGEELLVVVIKDIRRRKIERSHAQDRKSTRLNSSHKPISYAVFCLKKKKI